MARKKSAPDDAPKKPTKVASAPPTTAQRLGSLLKSARDKLRKDKGLNGDLDRLPLLTWVMFLKFLDDAEKAREADAIMSGKRYRPAVEKPYRWRDWAADPAGLTGDDLLEFVNLPNAHRPDATEGPGLLPYLRTLPDTGEADDPRRVIREFFAGVTNRIEAGTILRDIVNLVNGLNFNAADQIHTLGHLYESLLKEMRDAAGDSGEFYTPRPVVRFMVEVADPRIGETVLDPACGTAGFLVEAYQHLFRQVKRTEDRRKLQAGTLFGIEAKPLPYMLAQMNMLLHGIEVPDVVRTNSLAVRLAEIGDRDRVDVILTNPPFGGEEEASVQTNFPEGKRTSETALLFLQLIMRRLRRPIGARKTVGRAGVVVPNGILFGDGVCATIKRELLTDFRLHTIVRLPNGVFAPYTPIPTNLMFFDRSGPTADVWYYEVPPPEGRKQYSKTQPLQYEAFADCLKWWNDRDENDRAWKVPASELLESGCNLDRKNPRSRRDVEHLPPEQIVADILDKERRIIEIVTEIQRLLAEGPT